MQMGQMDLLVNFWDNIVNKVCNRFLGSTFVGHAWHKDLLDDFTSLLDLLDQSNLLQVSMDGPDVNWAFFSELRNYQAKNYMTKLLGTGSCGIHFIHEAF